MKCLDESMSSWLNQYCPGFVFATRKPRLSGNKYCYIADGDRGKPNMWHIKLQEGKDKPMDQNNNPSYPIEFKNHTNISEFILYMTKLIHNSDKIVTVDSGFCVAEEIFALHHIGVYRQAFIKKQGQSMFLEMILRSIWKTRNLEISKHANNALMERTSLYTGRKTVTMWQNSWALMGLRCKRITQIFASSMENGRGSKMWNQCRNTTKANAGWMMWTISVMIQLVLRMFWQQSGGQPGSLRSFVLLQKWMQWTLEHMQPRTIQNCNSHFTEIWL